ncbi:hypothetical protein OQA88_1114 [Cercophora sp. LCS_1]
MASLSVDITETQGRSDEYPSNLGPNIGGMPFGALDRYQNRLKARESDLFVSSDDDVEVRFRDLGFEGRARWQYNAHSEAKVKGHIGILHARNHAGQRGLVTASKEDPMSRFIYLFSDHSRDKLRALRSTVAVIFTYHGVMPAYLDFFDCFGLQSSPRDVRYSGFRKHVVLPRQGVAVPVDSLGRSGCQYQVAYNLKGVSLNGTGGWSIRNAAFYHRFDVVSGRAVWIVTKGRKDVCDAYEDLTGEDGRADDTSFATGGKCFVSSLAPHLLFSRWSNDDWRGYMRELEEAVDDESGVAKLGPRENGRLAQRYGSNDVRRMQIREEQASEADVILQGNIDILVSLQQFYQGLVKDDRFPFRASCAGEISDFLGNLDTIVSDMKNNASRAKALMKKTADRKELIKQYRADDEAGRMGRLNRNMEQETIVVRIITLVTLMYLPATFVSTLFSTDIIKYQEDNYPDGKYSQVAMNRWLQVTIPLTAVTLLAAWCAMKRATGRAARAVEGGYSGDASEPIGAVEGAIEHSSLPLRRRIEGWLRVPGTGLTEISAKLPLWAGKKGGAEAFP